MPRQQTKQSLQRFLEGLSTILGGLAGISFLFGSAVIYAAEKADRLLAEVIGIGVTFLFLILAVIAKHKAEDLQWEAENQDLIEAAKEPNPQGKPTS